MPRRTAQFKLNSASNLSIKILRAVLQVDIVYTLYNVGSVPQRLLSTMEAIQYWEGIASVLQGEASVLWRVFSTQQYWTDVICGGLGK